MKLHFSKNVEITRYVVSDMRGDIVESTSTYYVYRDHKIYYANFNRHYPIEIEDSKGNVVAMMATADESIVWIDNKVWIDNNVA